MFVSIHLFTFCKVSKSIGLPHTHVHTHTHTHTHKHTCTHTCTHTHTHTQNTLQGKLGIPLISTDFKQCTWLRPTCRWKICQYQGIRRYTGITSIYSSALPYNKYKCSVILFLCKCIGYPCTLRNIFSHRPLLCKPEISDLLEKGRID